jgi:hypothetical protein
MRRASYAAGAIACLAAVSAAPSAAQAPTPPAQAPTPPAQVPLLPDLVQEVPRNVGVVRKPAPAKGWFLTFRSAVGNNGPGNLILVGHRASTAEPQMVTDQVLDVRDTATSAFTTQMVRPNVGRMHYELFPDHQHWHLLGFERFELRRTNGRIAARDHKQGFCVGSRYPTPYGAQARAQATGPPDGVGLITWRQFDDRCGLSQTGALQVIAGMTPGYGDDYRAGIEGQFLDVTRVRAGHYVLIHRSNVPTRGTARLLETSYRNDVASVLIALKRRAGRRPTVTVLKRCPNSSRCALRSRKRR